jgi:hypothetical protein
MSTGVPNPDAPGSDQPEPEFTRLPDLAALTETDAEKAVADRPAKPLGDPPAALRNSLAG